LYVIGRVNAKLVALNTCYYSFVETGLLHRHPSDRNLADAWINGKRQLFNM